MDDFDWMKTIKWNLLSLRSVGLWPAGYEFYKFDLYLIYSITANITIVLGHNVSQVINLFYVYSNIDELSATIFVGTTNVLGLVKRIFFVRDLRTIKTLFKTLNTDPFRPRNSRHMKLVKINLGNWMKFFLWYTVAVYIDVAIWSIVPIVNNWVNDHKLPFQAWYPFDTNVSPYYEVAYFYQVFATWYLTVGHINLDSFMYAFMMFIGAQCDILRDELKSLEDDESYGPKLTTCIKHHKQILRFTEKSGNFFNYIVLAQLASSIAALALSMFNLSLVSDYSSDRALTHLGYICGMSTEIFLYCWFGNEVEFKSREIPYAAFKSKWIGQSKTVIQNLHIFCLRCQTPIKITAINLFTLSLQTFLSIMRSAWSYFAVLSTVNKK